MSTLQLAQELAADRPGVVIGVILGRLLIFGAVIGLVVWLIVRSSRKRQMPPQQPPYNGYWQAQQQHPGAAWTYPPPVGYPIPNAGWQGQYLPPQQPGGSWPGPPAPGYGYPAPYPAAQPPLQQSVAPWQYQTGSEHQVAEAVAYPPLPDVGGQGQYPWPPQPSAPWPGPPSAPGAEWSPPHATQPPDHLP
ncbi:hypothetical protein ACNQVK_01945 [Mycobacterium sp. 134]|uniref:hypothetical protein n=1 Tax=Mycobacterium sp. 134 TaxID=3400425 RepID=UPI003AAFDEC8